MSHVLGYPDRGSSNFDLDALVRGARQERSKAWVRIPVTIVVSGFLFAFCPLPTAVIWLSVALALEAGSAWARTRLARGEVRYGPANVGFILAISLWWCAHALLLWGVPHELARIATLMDLFTVALYGALGGHRERHVMIAMIAPPLVVLCAILIHAAWTTTSAPVAMIASLGTIGACLIVAVNGWSMHKFDAQVHEAHRALQIERDSLEARVAERTRELSVAMARAEAASAAKSQFLAIMSHELRTPLNAIIGYAEMIGEDIAAGAQPNAADAATILGSGRRLLRSINDVLDLASVEAGRMSVLLEPTNVRDILESAAASVAQLAEANGNVLSVEVDSSAGFVNTDARRLLQCLTQLTDNACKFTRDGAVSLGAEVRETSDGRVLAIIIADTGRGMSEQDLAALFQPFTQANQGMSRSHEGSGLGLAITKRMIDLLGGEIEFSSAVGKGTRVTIFIPDAPAFYA